jgi:hypothetical protein
LRRNGSAQAEEGQDGQNDDDQSDEIDDTVHDDSPFDRETERKIVLHRQSSGVAAAV